MALLAVSLDLAVAQQCSVKLEASNGTDLDNFGCSVSLKGPLALIGASASAGGGSAYVFRFDGTSWIEEQELHAANPSGHGGFGYAVACDGERLLVSSPGEDNGIGAAYVFRWNGAIWKQEQRLVAFDDRATRFGEAVALDGEVALVGAPDGFSTGSAYVYRLLGSFWVPEQRLVPNDPGRATFGKSVSIDGDRLVVGASDSAKHPDPGAAYIFRREGTRWTVVQKVTSDSGLDEEFFAISLSLDANVLVVGDPAGPEVVHVYRFDGTSFVKEEELRPSDAAYHFGRSVSVSGDVVLVDSSQAPYVYRWDGATWREQQELSVSYREGFFDVATMVCVNGDHALIGEGRQASGIPSSSLRAQSSSRGTSTSCSTPRALHGHRPHLIRQPLAWPLLRMA